MPTKTLKSMAKKSNKSSKDLERYWGQAKKQAKKKGVKNKYAYMMGIVKKRAGLGENTEPEGELTKEEAFNKIMTGLAQAIGQCIERFGPKLDIQLAIKPQIDNLPQLLSSDVERLKNKIVREYMLMNKITINESIRPSSYSP